MCIVECRNLSFSYKQGEPILKDISFSISQGQLISLIGPNGAGKSTLLNCVCGFLKPEKGEVYLDKKNINQLSRRQIASLISYVPQKVDVPFDYTVRDYVVMGRTAHLTMFQMPCKNDYDLVFDSLKKLGIEGLINRPVNTLSGGEQQKVCIARAIAQNPRLIVLDEPTASLDYGNQIHFLHLIKELSSSGYAILMSTHNPDHALLLGSDVALLNKKGVFEYGNCNEMITSERLSSLYGVQLFTSYSSIYGRTICLPVVI